MQSTKKFMEKLERQARTNPGHKTKYVQPLRPRSTVFKSKKAYNRQASKRAVLASALAVGMIFSFAGCSKKDKMDTAAIKASAEATCENIVDMNYNKLLRTVSDDTSDDTFDVLQSICGYSQNPEFNEDEVQIVEYILSHTSFEIDEENIKADEKKKDVFVVPVEFTMPDIRVANTNANTLNLPTYLSELEGADDWTIEVELEYIKVDDSNYSLNNLDDLLPVYEFMNFAGTTDFIPTYADFVEAGSYVGLSEDAAYHDCQQIEYHLTFAEGFELTENDVITSKVTYKASEDAEDVVIFEGEGVDIVIPVTETEIADANGYYPAGTYTVTFSDKNDTVIHFETVTVYAYVIPATPTPVPITEANMEAGSAGTIVYTGNCGFINCTGDFRWYDTSANDFVDSGVYAEGTSKIRLTASVESYYSESVHYTWWYSAEGDWSTATEAGSGDSTPTKDGGVYYYRFDLGNNPANGTYWCVLSNADGSVNYLVSRCVIGG